MSLPPELEDALKGWNEQWQSLVSIDGSTAAAADQWAAWQREGLTLLADLRSALEGGVEVRPEFLLDD